jgi:Cu(I)/Ag(I) efflux system membrane fusion protein
MGPAVHVDVGGRTVALCCRACIPELKSAPGKYLHGPESLPDDQVLCVPESAVVDSGTRKVVYVESIPGLFQGRAVVLGPRIGDRFPVISGLSQGEKVAEAGAFLIDAESRLNGNAPAPALPDAAPRKATEPPGPAEGPTRSAALTTEGVHRHGAGRR